jgi:hypothetical protein
MEVKPLREAIGRYMVPKKKNPKPRVIPSEVQKEKMRLLLHEWVKTTTMRQGILLVDY